MATCFKMTIAQLKTEEKIVKKFLRELNPKVRFVGEAYLNSSEKGLSLVITYSLPASGVTQTYAVAL